MILNDKTIRHALLALVGLCGVLYAEPPPADSELLGVLNEYRQIRESSGLAISQIRESIFWTHNDSGDQPRLYALNDRCELIATCYVRGASAIDWEDMASFQSNDKPFLIVGDIGDNFHRRKSCCLYVIPEHDLPVSELQTHRKICFTYRDGPQDCESLCIDSRDRTIFLVSKSWKPQSSIYKLAWPKPGDESIQVANKIATVNLGGITGMDMSPDGRRAIIVSYTNAYEFVRLEDEDWESAFKRKPQPIALPAREQGESICYGPNSACIYLTSESKRKPMPLLKVTPPNKPQPKKAR